MARPPSSFTGVLLLRPLGRDRSYSQSFSRSMFIAIDPTRIAILPESRCFGRLGAVAYGLHEALEILR
jgi:hypothetical protein